MFVGEGVGYVLMVQGIYKSKSVSAVDTRRFLFNGVPGGPKSNELLGMVGGTPDSDRVRVLGSMT